MVAHSRRALVDELAAFGRLLEVGVGDRPGVARALADRGCDVVAIDVDAGDAPAIDGARRGSVRTQRGDVVALADAADPIGALRTSAEDDAVDAVYGLNLPAELQRPTVEVAAGLDAACLFTTLGFEEPVVPVRRRSLPEATLFVARTGPDGGSSSAETDGPPR